MWSCCKRARKQIFRFEHGTLVRATDSFKAIELLRSISLKSNDVEHDEYKGYIIKFHPNVLIKTDEPDLVRARRAAEWFAYLDRRELKIVETLS
jgi:hypothetical protein